VWLRGWFCFGNAVTDDISSLIFMGIAIVGIIAALWFWRR